MSNERKLTIAPIPQPLWKFNLREFLTQTQWRKLRVGVIAEHNAMCQTCGKNVSAPRAAHVHEEWEYNTAASPAVCKLTGLALACWHCHMAEHIGMLETLVSNGTLKKTAITETIANYCRVNNVDEATFKADRKRAIAEWRKLSTLEWVIDWGDYAEMLLEEYTELPQLHWDADLDKQSA